MAQLDYEAAILVLEQTFDEVQRHLQENHSVQFAPELQLHLDALFSSNTQAYREVLIGCLLAKLQDAHVDVHLPYVGHGPTAYNARDLDEQVVNPFLQSKQIPSSKGPYLNVFRRGIKFTKSTREGLRDKKGYDSFLVLVDHVSGTTDDNQLRSILRALLAKFIQLREESHIAVARVHRVSLVQLRSLITNLLAIPSGGRFPVFLVVATFRALNDAFDLGWTVDYQGINVADAASGEAGDITVRQSGNILIVAEVTERIVSKSRVISTFTTKIAPLGIQDYLFFVREADPDAYRQAHQYFSQGHEVNFLEIQRWIYDILAVSGARGRTSFIHHLIEMLDQRDVPRIMKVSWNDLILKLTES